MTASKENSGILFLADISGYTEFVTRTEIDHGTEILVTLINVVIQETKPPLKLQEVEGDAVFSYALDETLERGPLLLDLIDVMYEAFRSALDRVVACRTCTCRACASAEDLDMKFVVHHGTFARRATTGHEGISGPDVILVHRLLKNRIEQETGYTAYAFFTASVIEALALADLTSGMVEHDESYEHLGEVRGWVYDVRRQRDLAHLNREVRLPLEGAFLALTSVFRVSPAVAWERYANSRYREQWLQADRWTLERDGAGRNGVATTEHCQIGQRSLSIRTLDWKPLRYATQALQFPWGGRLSYMTAFEDSGRGTTVTMIFGRPDHDRPLPRILLALTVLVLGGLLRRRLTDRCNALFALIRAAENASAEDLPELRSSR